MTSKEKIMLLAQAGVEGADWYDRAQTSIMDVCAAHNVDPTKFILGLAVLSPRISVEQNIRKALQWFMFGERPHMMRSINVSFERLIDSGYDPASVTGPKTSRFAAALLGDHNAVVIDTHMVQALGIPSTRRPNKREQREAEKRFGWVGNRLDLSPRDTQAAVWTGQRAALGWPPSYITTDSINQVLATVAPDEPF